MKKLIWFAAMGAVLAAVVLFVVFYGGREEAPPEEISETELLGILTRGDGWAFDEESGTLSITKDEPAQEWRDFTLVVKNLALMEGVTTVGASAFSGCSGLTSVQLPSTVETVVDSAFDACGLEELIIPNPACKIVVDPEGGSQLAEVICACEDSPAQEWAMVTGHEFRPFPAQ